MKHEAGRDSETDELYFRSECENDMEEEAIRLFIYGCMEAGFIHEMLDLADTDKVKNLGAKLQSENENLTNEEKAGLFTRDMLAGLRKKIKNIA